MPRRATHLRRAALTLLAGLAASLGASAREGAQGAFPPLAPPGARADAFPMPDRPIAEIISPIWATEAERDGVDEVGQIARALGLGPGMTVADIGAGSGFHTVRLAPIVGPTGRILAQDVTPTYLDGLAGRVAAAGLTNVTLALGEPHDPRLPAASVDVALLVHMYHEIAQPFAFLHNLRPALRPGATVAIVDLDRDTWRHGTPRALLRCELAAAGYRQTGFVTLRGNIGYLATFAPDEAPAALRPGAAPACSATRGVTR